MIHARRAAILVGLAWGCAPLAAQPPAAGAGFPFETCLSLFADREAPEDTRRTRQAEALERRAEEERSTPLGAGGVAPALATAVSLVATDSGGRALLSLSGSPAGAGHREWTVTASAPFDEDDGEGSFVSKAGLNGDIVLSVALSGHSWRLQARPYGAALCSACRDEGLSLLECNLADLQAHWERALGEPEAGRRREELESTLWGLSPLRLWGGELSAGREPREFFEVDGSTGEEDRVGYSAALFGGRLLGDTWSVYGRGTWKRDFEEQDEVSLCESVDGTPFESCEELPFGEADEEESLVVSLQAVRYFARLFHLDRGWAVAPSALYDLDEAEWELQLPLYLATDEDGDFTGGLKGIWTPDGEEEWGFSVFITKPLESWSGH